MKLYKSFKHALNMVLHSRLRSWLTILGIVIGVAAVIAIVSLSNSLESEMNDQLDDFGADLLTLSAGSSRAFGFGPGMGGGRPGEGSSGATEEGEEVELDRMDVQALKAVSDIKTISPQISGSADIYYVAEKGSVQVTGVDPAAWVEVTDIDLASGRLLGPADTNVIIVGGRIADGFFDKQLGINQLVTIEDRLFRIVGIIDDSSTTVYMPLAVAYDVLEDSEEGVYDSITIQIKDVDNLDTAMEAIEKKLMIARHVLSEEKKDFSLTSNAQMQETRAEMMSSMTTFLTAIAAVALLVGVVGVANSMFTSVLEKTKDIGIMKAIGARNSDILLIFLLNAAIIGLIGGLLGVMLGVVLAGFLPALMGESGGMMARLASGGGALSLRILGVGLGISITMGIISGIVPALQASRLKPVDALRYE